MAAAAYSPPFSLGPPPLATYNIDEKKAEEFIVPAPPIRTVVTPREILAEGVRPIMIATTPPAVASDGLPTIQARPIGGPPASPPIQLNLPPVPMAQLPAAPVKPARPNYAAMTAEQQADMRNTFKVKFGQLRAGNPTWKIDDPAEGTALDSIHDLYEGYVKQIVISMNCRNWKIYLIIYFFGMEFFIKSKLNIAEIDNFATFQMEIVNQYDSYLVEIGEKYYTAGASAWPVELRLLGYSGVLAILFIIVKKMVNKIGGDDNQVRSVLRNITSTMNGQPAVTAATQVRDAAGIAEPPVAAAGGGGDLLGMLGGLMNGGAGGAGGFDLGRIFSSLTGNSAATTASASASTATSSAARAAPHSE